MTALRVALFTDSDVFAGTESYIFDLGHGLRDLGVEVRIACPTPSVLAEKAGGAAFPIVSIRKGGLIDREAVRTLVGLLQSGEIHIVHANNGRTMLSAALAVSRAGQGVSVATQHFLEPDHVTRRGVKAVVYHAAHRWVNRRTQHFIAISEAVRQAMLKRGEATEQNTTVVPNGIRLFDPEALTSPAQVRADLGLGAETPLIVCAARLEREKDLASLVRAMEDVQQRFPAAVCLLAGEGTQREALAAQIRQSGMERSVRLLGFRSDAKALIRAADLFVLPSLAEPFGLVLLEAMAVEKPVIATRSGAPPEIVREGETGLLVTPSAPSELADAICRLLVDPGAAEAMGRQGRARFESHYTAARMAQATLSVYRRLCPE